MQSNFGKRIRLAAQSFPKGISPKTAVILGSGLGGIASLLSHYQEIPFSSIPEFPKPSVQGHDGKMFLSNENIIIAGRVHFYEGHPMDDVVFSIFLLKELGIENIILTNAAGAVNKNYNPGNLVLIKDHINLMGTNPFIGPNPKNADGIDYGSRFFDMSNVYDDSLRALAQKIVSTPMSEGVYAALPGPCYETPSEIKMLSTIGADLVGMSTVPEAMAANYLGMKVLGISCVTNMAAGIQKTPLNHQEVVDVGKKVEGELKFLILELLKVIS